MSGNPVRDAALAYLRLSWSVLPLGRGSKRPMVAWQSLQDAPATVETVASWFENWPEANVGIVTGRVSGLVVVDIDVGHGGDESMADLERRFGTLLPTVESVTGGGGRHLYFAHPGGQVRNRVALAPGVDIRGDGGYVVAPPSLHPSGRRYAWRKGREAGRIALAAIPGWLKRKIVAGTGERTGHPMAYWRRLVTEGVAEGQRNNTIASLTGHLLWHGVDPDVVTDLMLCWNAERCRPPLPDEEVVRTVKSITRSHFRQQGGGMSEA